jgi:ornithine cyclodeaminase
MKNLDPRPLVDLLGEAFQDHSERHDRSVPGLDFRFAGGSISCSRMGVTPHIPAYTLKLEGKLPAMTPSISGLIHLYDRDTGQLLALLESSHISAVSSALTAALATDLMAAPNARRLAVVGTGVQGWLVVRFLMEMRQLEQVTLFDMVRKRSRKMAERLVKYDGVEVRVGDALTETVANADIILCATWSKTPFLFSEMVLPGAHITTLGSDERGKKELSAELIRASTFFCDDRELAHAKGPLYGLKGTQDMGTRELGEVLSGAIQPRSSAEEVTVYGPVGLPFQDLIAAWATYQKAVSRGHGQPVSHLA